MQTVAVIGAGTMGHGIAQVFAMADYDVTLVDASEAALDKGLAAVVQNLDKGVDRGKVRDDKRTSTLARLSGTADLAEAVEDADLVIEAVPESMTLKQSLFTQAQASAPDSAIFATNTSSLSIAKIAGVLTDPSRVIGMHFFNPVHIMALLEVVVGKDTRDDVLDAVKEAGKRIGK
ncbi:MAG: 3-hydroxybutyryl-CoA dehydrogenase, partial [Myxococcota bacterium]